MPTHKVLLVDSHPIIRTSLKYNLEETQIFQVVSSASDSDKAYFEALDKHPDLIITEVDVAGRGITSVAEQVQSRLPATRLVFYTTFLSDVFLDLSLRVGATGYILKTEPLEGVIDMIQRVMRGENCYSAEAMDRLEYSREERAYRVKSLSYLSTLTVRQIQVLRHLVTGRSVKEVAKVMKLSERAIESHKYRIMQHLEIHDRVDLTRFAIREGLISV